MNTVAANAPWIDPRIDPIQRYQACKAMARGYAMAEKSVEARLGHAHAFCAAVICSYWDVICERLNTDFSVKQLTTDLPPLVVDVQHVADETGRLIAEFPVEDAGYLIGSLYTVMLPDVQRSAMGAYYTPPPLVSRLLDMAEQAGFDFATGSAIDPACGGGAILAPLALRMVAHANGADPAWTLRHLDVRLKGTDIDPFAAWMAQVLVEAAILPLCVSARRRLADVVTVADSLCPAAEASSFDLVIGNPPYGRVTLNEPMRNFYGRSLFGHANLYGLFTDLALRLAKPSGVIAYLTPTSFLGGQYFKALRRLVTAEATAVGFDFVSDREGVFDNVLQETMLATYVYDIRDVAAEISALIPQGLNAARVEKLGSVKVGTSGEPWLLPRTKEDAAILAAMESMPTRLAGLGYAVSTGPLVWNRHRTQLRTERNVNTLPLIWAESVTSNGFAFKADRRGHVPYFAPEQSQPHLITKTTCVLVQRTTSKEQGRRLVVAILPQEFLDSNGGAVVENHLNMVYAPSASLARVTPMMIATLLSTEALDRVFRCISGSVAVSAYELNALPLPDVAQMCRLETMLLNGSPKSTVERLVSSFYGIS
ncbi:Eco57I restriction-modification methylase domain-containing protein [Pseudomonas syringae group genomosp. 3]|uniref:site-specific DNA-methyltransferase (adenine-specific) n=1 Tax=Pseudomonas syringae pv. primulae TaxID=251707 RepID=A0A3M3XAT6_9PSED|nr:Eco57I restriction-modification methylase domain-containing protein [Pseudomonas syringae group genomosp. 3]RMO67076.1 Eco57I restriction endonuclease [Pseudomonas syringae pv. primulae]